jgi:hypothetical protein
MNLPQPSLPFSMGSAPAAGAGAVGAMTPQSIGHMGGPPFAHQPPAMAPAAPPVSSAAPPGGFSNIPPQFSGMHPDRLRALGYIK